MIISLHAIAKNNERFLMKISHKKTSRLQGFYFFLLKILMSDNGA